jgi:hypothetical protein
MFSSRLPASLATNALTDAIRDRRAAGGSWIDLTVTNPTTVGLDYPAEILAPLADAAGRTYAPEPRGLESARTAVAADYERRGRHVSPDRIVLTASTSEAYSLLFKLLCDAGDDVLVPQPSYPLFDLLAGLDAVTPRPYRLLEDVGWSIDRESVLAAITPRTRALLVVSPNNPTGSIVTADDLAWLSDECARRDIALIVDEVFADYPLAPRGEGATISGREPALTFALGGLSKSAGLPQVKLGWMAVSGSDALVDAALERLDVIGDTYLSVSTPVQVAAPSLIAAGAAVRAAIHARVRRNLAALGDALRRHPSMTFREPEAGWSAAWRIPALEPEEATVLRLFADAEVLVHPGYFFDFAREAVLVTSLLPPPETFDRGIARVLSTILAGRA